MKYNNIDQYIEQCEKEIQTILNKIRNTIKNAAPNSIEKISYNIPTFYQKENIVQFAAYKNHIGFYPTPEAIEAFSEELKAYKTTKGTIQFSYDKEIPYLLIRKIVEYRIKQITLSK